MHTTELNTMSSIIIIAEHKANPNQDPANWYPGATE